MKYITIILLLLVSSVRADESLQREIQFAKADYQARKVRLEKLDNMSYVHFLDFYKATAFGDTTGIKLCERHLAAIEKAKTVDAADQIELAQELGTTLIGIIKLKEAKLTGFRIDVEDSKKKLGALEQKKKQNKALDPTR